MLDMVLHDLDHHDGVIHDQPDGKHQPEQGEGIDGETKQREEGKGADQRDRHGQQRDERGAPALQEDEHHDDDQHHRFEQCVLDFLHPLGHRQRRVQRDDVVQVGREAQFQSGHEFLRPVGGIHGIGTRQLVKGNQGARPPLSRASMS